MKRTAEYLSCVWVKRLKKSFPFAAYSGLLAHTVIWFQKLCQWTLKITNDWTIRVMLSGVVVVVHIFCCVLGNLVRIRWNTVFPQNTFDNVMIISLSKRLLRLMKNVTMERHGNSKAPLCWRVDVRGCERVGFEGCLRTVGEMRHGEHTCASVFYTSLSLSNWARCATIKCFGFLPLIMSTQIHHGAKHFLFFLVLSHHACFLMFASREII